METPVRRPAYWEFELAGGVSYGQRGVYFFSARWPFAVLRASPRELRFHARWSWEPDRVIGREHVQRITLGRGLFLRGVRFEHDLARVPRQLVFWTEQSKRLLTELRAMGYPV